MCLIWTGAKWDIHKQANTGTAAPRSPHTLTRLLALDAAKLPRVFVELTATLYKHPGTCGASGASYRAPRVIACHSKKNAQQPRPCGRNTFITTSYAPRPDWPVVRDTLSHLLLHTPRRRKETRDKDDTHTNTHGSRSQNKTTSDRDAQQGSASIDTG